MRSGEDALPHALLDDAVVEAGWREAGAAIGGALAIEQAIAQAIAPAAEQAAGRPSQALSSIAKHLGSQGTLRLVVDGRDGGRFERVSWRAVCLARERLGHASPLIELAFAMQGLGSYPITLKGTASQRAAWLPGVVSGESVAAFALTEPEAGSDLGGICTTARREGNDYVLDGHKVFISNAGVAGFYSLFARTAPKDAPRGLSAFVVPAGTRGLSVRPTKVLGGHPIGEVLLEGVRVPIDHRLGEEGEGMSIALGTLHRFRATVGAAALGFASRALDEAIQHVKARRQFGAPLAEQQAVRLALADMACELEGARWLVYHAAALADRGASREEAGYASSMGKLVATEAAQRVVDRAVQLHGGRGVMHGSPVARLYEDVRALRIYEGASDVQRLLIARHLVEGG